MPILFRNGPAEEPFAFESIGQNWIQDRTTRLKGYPFYHYLQTEKGAGLVKAGGKTWILRENEGLLFAPFFPHSYEKYDHEWITCFASFTGTLEGGISVITGGRQLIFINEEQGKQLSEMIHSSFHLFSQRPADEKLLSTQCYTLLLNLAESRHSPGTDSRLYQTYVIPVIHEIEKNYALDLTVQSLSSLVYITPQYLAKLFRRFLGCSTYEYLTSFRISRAKELLLSNPRMEVQDIARQTGFADASHFIVMFKKYTRSTPIEFRKFH